MGGAVSELRHQIRDHVAIAKAYPQFLEPYLIVVQFFLNIAEEGEGLSREKRIDEVNPIDPNGNHRLFEEASTEVELLVENPLVLDVILYALNHYTTLELSPEVDPNRKWYDPPWRKAKKMQKYAEIPADEVTRYRTAVLRTSIRVLRLMTMCLEARLTLDEQGGAILLNKIANDNPLDDFIKNDVKAIFFQMYGGENAIKRIVIGNIQVVIELMNENQSSSLVQLEGIKRLCSLVSDASPHISSPVERPSSTIGDLTTAPIDLTISKAVFQAGFDVKPNQSPPLSVVTTTTTINAKSEPSAILSYPSEYIVQPRPIQEHGNQQSQTLSQQEFTHDQLKIFEELEIYGAASVVAQVLNRFSVEDCIGIYVNAMRFFILTCINERFSKVVGQNGGIEGAIRLLFRSRELFRLQKWEEKQLAVKNASTVGEEIFNKPTVGHAEQEEEEKENEADNHRHQPKEVNNDPKTKVKKITKKEKEIARKLQVDYTPIEIGQQAIWALDLLATMEYNVSLMKRSGLKYLLEEIRLDPEARELGEMLIVTRKLRMIRWDEVIDPVDPRTTPTKSKVQGKEISSTKPFGPK